MKSPSTDFCEVGTDTCVHLDDANAVKRVLLDYVRRYGLTDAAREVFARPQSGAAASAGGEAALFIGYREAG